MTEDSASARRRIVLRVVFVAYLVILGFIVFWPQHVDGAAVPVIDAVHRQVPPVTYNRVEFAANIGLFVPFGLLLTPLMRRWWAVVPIGFAVTSTIELVQATLLPGRTGSLLDIAANTLGTAIGMLLALAARYLVLRKRTAAHTPR